MSSFWVVFLCVHAGPEVENFLRVRIAAAILVIVATRNTIVPIVWRCWTAGAR